jgi:hypothetical protein
VAHGTLEKRTFSYSEWILDSSRLAVDVRWAPSKRKEGSSKLRRAREGGLINSGVPRPS